LIDINDYLEDDASVYFASLRPYQDPTEKEGSMGVSIGYPRIGHQKNADLAWTVPVTVVVSIVAAAIWILLAGLSGPVAIGADGLDGIALTAP
jgi:hypothetical protein